MNFQPPRSSCYVDVMAQKASGNSDSLRGFGDIIGVVLLAAALLLLVAQWSFDWHDISALANPPDKPVHNWIGAFGAYFAWIVFQAVGMAAYLVPLLLAAFGAALLLGFLHYLLERLRWSVLWSFMLLLSVTGLLHIADKAHLLGHLDQRIGSHSAGGWLGYLTYGESPQYQWGFSLFGRIGAIIVYATLYLVSLLFLTDFRLGEWLRAWIKRPKAGEVSEEEATLERRAHELQKQAKKLQEEVARSGLGADLQPVPEPTVRDLSVPQAKGPRFRKTTLPSGAKELAGRDETTATRRKP
ncbi:MAG TPA: DNA translocase FtsK 4TM domain-containing protein, partial [Verrucomicrobiae bacterium]|nr:DNA translocase FtsK 4TM domain-containing protein [Verrucomicrobiae bacterium]